VFEKVDTFWTYQTYTRITNNGKHDNQVSKVH
jgi:hypothetical protein